jgi:hypothetical protein
MIHLATNALFFAIVLASCADPPNSRESRFVPAPTSDAQVQSPEHDREHVYLTTFNFHGVSMEIELRTKNSCLAGGQIFFGFDDAESSGIAFAA